MKYLTGISQGFDKCAKAALQNNYFCRTPPDDCLYFETWSRYHYNKKRQKFKTILIGRSSRQMNRNKNLLRLYLWKISTFSTFTACSKFSFYVSFFQINCIKIQTLSLVLNLSEISAGILFVFIYFDVIIRQWQKKNSS